MKQIFEIETPSGMTTNYLRQLFIDKNPLIEDKYISVTELSDNSNGITVIEKLGKDLKVGDIFKSTQSESKWSEGWFTMTKELPSIFNKSFLTTLYIVKSLPTSNDINTVEKEFKEFISENDKDNPYTENDYFNFFKPYLSNIPISKSIN